MIIAAMLTSVLVIDEGLTYDIENTLNNIWNGLVEIWENIKDMYHRTIASWKGKTADVNEADIFDAEIDEILFEDEIDDEFENDEDVETDDEIEIVEDVEMDDEFENDEDLEEKEDEEESN